MELVGASLARKWENTIAMILPLTSDALGKTALASTLAAVTSNTEHIFERHCVIMGYNLKQKFLY